MKRVLWILGVAGLVCAVLFFGYTTIYGVGEVPLEAVRGGVLQYYHCPGNPEECPTPAPMPTPTCILTVPCPVITPTPYPTQPPLKTPGAP